MRAISYAAFGGTPELVELPDPIAPPGGAVVRVHATGVCRSDWHAWQGHDASVTLPHVPGHEFAGVVEAVGEGVASFAPGDRVTAPFILACGECAQCRAGASQVCPRQRQPGFDLPGSYAEKVLVLAADHNLVALPEEIDMRAAAGLGCRFGTAYHAVHVQARLRAGETLAVFGCGGVGLSVIQIAVAAGAEVIGVDVSAPALEAARALGARAIDATGAAERIRALTGGGADATMDALGSAATASAAIESLRPRGRHVQVGLLLGADAQRPLPMSRVIAQELQVLGSHGLAVAEYRDLLADIAAERLDPQAAVGRTIGFEELPEALMAMGRGAAGAGMTVALLS
ncbi:alcohol dehydrogenase catalytic domain-containing protein [Brachybacterium hainanense]|uniref:Alcohol dehydrogenase catalytic domain-containing protein n=1 Tax=Brachybacterium hainanense TaxID=1541174 RepID=A0ABV6RH89_9MICO